MTGDQLMALQKMVSWYALQADVELLRAVDPDLPQAQRESAKRRRNHFLTLIDNALAKATDMMYQG